MNGRLISGSDVDRTDTWVKYRAGMCTTCRATCCSMPTEVRFDDLVRLGLVDAFEANIPAKQIAKRLFAQRVIEHFNGRDQIYTLARRTSGDCLYLDAKSRLCTVYANRPNTCRKHPEVGPRPGFCAYRGKIE
jgi:uncharacterized protein